MWYYLVLWKESKLLHQEAKNSTSTTSNMFFFLFFFLFSRWGSDRTSHPELPRKHRHLCQRWHHRDRRFVDRADGRRQFGRSHQRGSRLCSRQCLPSWCYSSLLHLRRSVWKHCHLPVLCRNFWYVKVLQWFRTHTIQNSHKRSFNLIVICIFVHVIMEEICWNFW